MRKTIDIPTALERANYYLAGEDATPEARLRREGVASFLEVLLHDADAYAGFHYLSSATDESRRAYYTHKRLVNS